MQKIIITEQQFNTLMSSQIKEDYMSSLSSQNNVNKKGSITLDKKSAQPNDIKKYTDKGLNVTLLDEKLGEEQDIVYKHKFDGKKLNIYVTKEQSKVEDIMEYIYSINDQDKVEKAFEKGNVHLFIKDAASGRYQEMDKKIEHKYYKNIQGFKNFGKGSSKEDKQLNEPTTPFSDEK